MLITSCFKDTVCESKNSWLFQFATCRILNVAGINCKLFKDTVCESKNSWLFQFATCRSLNVAGVNYKLFKDTVCESKNSWLFHFATCRILNVAGINCKLFKGTVCESKNSWLFHFPENYDIQQPFGPGGAKRIFTLYGFRLAACFHILIVFLFHLLKCHDVRRFTVFYVLRMSRSLLRICF